MKLTTPTSHRQHIVFLGRCNSGKSSLINAISRQEVAIVSEIAGTTTDPVLKPIELPGIGATVLIDTPGYDDLTELGRQRVNSTTRSIDSADVAVVLCDERFDDEDVKWLTLLRQKGLVAVVAIAKSDTMTETETLFRKIKAMTDIEPVVVSAKTGRGIDDLLQAIAANCDTTHRLITEGLCDAGDTVVLVMPQDAQAPKGRLIKPQVETLRELLDRGCNAVCCKPENLPDVLNQLKTSPSLIITDSQVIATVSRHKPERTRLTSFSVLFARYKGDIDTFVKGAEKLLKLSSGARILIAESCSHIPQNEDIGRVKLPRMLRNRLGDDITIDIVGGNDFPEDLSSYDIVIQCGGCMFTRRHVMSRVNKALAQQIPITNYGIAIAALTDVLTCVSY